MLYRLRRFLDRLRGPLPPFDREPFEKLPYHVAEMACANPKHAEMIAALPRLN